MTLPQLVWYNFQIIRMNNERFTVPEILFNPQDVKIQEMGIAEGIVHAVSCLPEGTFYFGYYC